MKRVTMTLAQWTKLYDRDAKKEGWSLFDADGDITIMRIDEPEDGEGFLKGDLEALVLVTKNASQGDKKSLLALFLDGKRVYEKGSTWASRVMEKHCIPNSLKGKK